MKLSEEQVRQFWEDGFLIVENLLEKDEIQALRQRAEWVAQGEASHIAKTLLQVEPRVAAGETQAGNYADSLRKMSHLAFYDDTFQAHARNPKILDVIESLLGTHQYGVIEESKWAEYERMSVEGRLPEERPVELKTGSCSFHHGLILHASRPNLTEKRRRGYATHYVSAQCRFTGPAEKNDAMLVRGQSLPGHI